MVNGTGLTSREREILQQLQAQRAAEKPIAAPIAQQGAAQERAESTSPAATTDQAPPNLLQSAGNFALRGLGKAVNAISTTGELASLYTNYGLRTLGVGSEEDRQNLSQQIDAATASGFSWQSIGALKEVQRSRAQLFWGERLMTEVITDPLNLVGFGVLGKIPLAGRLLGPLEQAYISGVTKAVELPLKPIGAIARRLPEPVVFRTTKVRKDAFNTVKTAFESFHGDEPITRVTSPEVSKQFLDAVKGTEGLELEWPERMQVLQMLQRGTVMKDEIADLARYAGRSLDSKDMSLIDDMVSEAAGGRISKRQAAEFIVKATGQDPLNEAATLFAEEVVSNSIRRTHEFVGGLEKLSPLDMADSIASGMARKEADAIHSRIVETRMHQGAIGAVLNGLDPLYSGVWRNTLERWAARPLAEAVLGFGSLGPLNFLENATMVVSGGATPRFLSSDEYAEFFRGLPVSRPRLLREGKREARTVTQVGIALGPEDARTLHLPGFGGGKWDVFSKLRDFTSEQSADLLRGFEVQRYNRHLDRLIEDAPKRVAGIGGVAESGVTVQGIMGSAETLPVDVPDAYREAIIRRTKMGISSGNPETVRSVSRQFTEPKVVQKEVNSVIAKLDMLDPDTRDLFMRTRLVDDIPKNLQVARQNWEQRLMVTPEYADARMDGFLNRIRQTPPSTRTELAASFDALNQLVDDLNGTMTALMEAGHQNRLNLLQRGVPVKQAGRRAFDDIYATKEQFEATFRPKVHEAIAEVNRSAARLGIAQSDFKNFSEIASARAEAWADWWRRDTLAHNEHFALGGSAEDWIYKRSQLYGEFKPHLDQLNKAFAAQHDYMGAVIRDTSGVPVNQYFQDKAALLRNYLDTPANVLNDPRLTNLTAKFNTQLEQAGAELNQAIRQAPLSRPEEQQALKDWLDGIASQLEAAGQPAKTMLQDIRREAYAAATKDVDRAFINYDAQNTFDFVARHIYPFWMYESRVWPRLVRLGLQHPKALSFFGPEGTYFDHTDNGYTPLSQFPVQLAPVRGTMIGRLRRVYQRQFPEYEQGVYGEYLRWNDNIEKFGFYPGLHIGAPIGLLAAALDEHQEPRLGEFLPPSYDSAMSLLVGAGAFADVPGTEAVRRVFASDRFKDRSLNLFLFNQGIVPSEATAEQRRKAIATLSVYNAVEAQLSLTRYRPEAYDDYQKAREEAVAVVANIPVEQYRDMQKQGVNIRETQPFDPFQREQLRKLLTDQERQQAYLQINRPLRSSVETEKAVRLEQFWDGYDLEKNARLSAQQVNDALRASGRITGREWRDRRVDSNDKLRTSFDAAQRALRLSDEEMRSAYPASEMDKALRSYFEVDADKFKNAVGETNWRGFFAAQESTLDAYDTTTRAKVKAYLAESGTTMEQAYRKGQALGWGDYFDDEAAVRWYGERSGAGEMLQKALESEQARQREVVRLTEQGASAIELRLARRDTANTRAIERVQTLFRQDLIRRYPDIKEWLRQFYDRSVK